MKKGIELSVNFIVIFVLSIVVLIFGIKLTYDIVNMGREQNLFLTQQIMDELDRLGSQGDRISIAFNKETINHGKSQIFGLGVRNTDLSDPPKTYFTIGVENGPAVDENNVDILLPFKYVKALYNKNATILQDELKKIPIMVKVLGNAKPGTYILNVYVCISSTSPAGLCTSGSTNHYDTNNPARKIYVEVP